MIDHIGIEVENTPRSKAFYMAALAPLGYAIVMEFEGWCGLGRDGMPDFWIHGTTATKPGLHIAFASADRKTVDAFYAAAIKAGARDNGAPGIRAHYHPNYYGAFVIDPDGHNIEAVCHAAE